jgi:hypothetical protein
VTIRTTTRNSEQESSKPSNSPAKPNAKATRQSASQTTYLQHRGGDNGRERRERGWWAIVVAVVAVFDFHCKQNGIE